MGICIYDVVQNVRTVVSDYIDSMTEVKSKDVGLDPRCGKIYIGDNCVATKKSYDGYLQYYGGFEYINKEFRHEFGDYVFYSVEDDFYMEDDRVWAIINNHKESNV